MGPRSALRLQRVEDHVRLENAHDLDGLMSTFGASGFYDDEPWAEHHGGLDAVRGYYQDLLRAAPDFHIEVKRRHATEVDVILEVDVSGTHLGPWRGMPANAFITIARPCCDKWACIRADQLEGPPRRLAPAPCHCAAGIVGDPPPPRMILPRKARALSLTPLIAATYFMVAGGPYGLEELIAKAGYRGALWALIATPLIWSLPTAMMVGELAGAMPESGGYYVWVRRALGPFWGFQEAWLSLAASVFDMAIYPTLLVLYLGKLFPALASGIYGFAVGVVIIAASALWNMRGAKAVGGLSLWVGLVVLTPFGLMVLLSGAQPASAPSAPVEAGALAGILVAMWNYMGWDYASTIADEVERPERTYPLGILLTVALVVVTYVLPVWAARRAGLDPRDWSTGAWVDAGNAIGGRWLGTAIVLGAVVAAFGAFNSLVMSYSRVPVALAEHGVLPKVLAQRDPTTRAPRVAIAACAVAYAACLGLGFSRLLVLDVFLYGASLVLEFIALVMLRIREPDLPRRFRVPGGLAGAIAVGVVPTALLVAALVSSIRDGAAGPELVLGAVLLNLGPLIYWIRARRRRATTS